MLRLVARHRTGAYPKLLLAALIAAGCSNVLGIDDPTSKPPDGGAGTGGEAGEGPAANGGTQPMAGSGGGTAGGNAGSGGNGGTLAGQSGMAGTPSGAGEGGEAGAAGDPCPVKARCGGDSGKVPQLCDGGLWTTNTAESTGDCPVLCIAGKCEDCTDGDVRCNDKESQKCVGGAWQDQKNCASVCLDGACVTPPSCSGLGNHLCANSTSCCEAHEVPGGAFIRSYDAGDYSDPTFTATVSPFIMDRYEVTVGRMQSFVAAYPGLQFNASDGKAAHIAEDSGWRAAYPLPLTAAALKTQLSCPSTTWTEQLNGDINLPINCVNFYLAYAFCIWDGGRLPTEAEWNFAAAGGAQQRVYPWLAPPDTVANVDANAFFGQVDGLPIDVGARPGGDGRWHQSDLAGNLAEWNLDFSANPYTSTACHDCMNTDSAPTRVLRGGAYTYDADSIKVSARDNQAPDQSFFLNGFRCVRDVSEMPPQ